MDALKLDYHVTVVIDGCRSVDVMPGDGQRAFSTMNKAGARLITSSDLICELQKRKNP
jgi:nicotinamidase/pyrazinamidase